jgi:hypothetical protein
MRKILSSFVVLAFALALGTGVAAAKSKDAMMGGTAMTTTCPTGSTWVKSYKNKAGKIVKGYCRKTATKKGKM